jgi:8-oxo-dGTP pyrophosphatase MutT (NUDIX family)
MIPKNAKLVFKGILFDVYQWKQKMFDGSFQTYECIKRKPTVQIIVEFNGKIAILSEIQPGTKKFTGLAGGWIENGESPLNSAKRELKEELGFKAKKLIFWKKTMMSSKIEWYSNYFIAKGCTKVSMQSLDSGEKIKISLLSFEDFLKATQKDDFRNKEFQAIICKMMSDKKKLNEFKK